MRRFVFLASAVLITALAPLKAQQSPQQIISRLEIYNVETGERKVVAEFDYNIQAPNWTPDGKYLICNSRGLMYRMPVEGGTPEFINTGNVISCNNDHVVSFDGTLLYISGSGPAGGSQVYVLPITGGYPRLVTEKSPSYLHGITPDGKWLAYCAGRNDNMDVYVIPTAGGEEIRLTTAEGLDDGPEYSPDGKHIWFNSVRTGLMQVWRMNADGTDQTQMTTDESNSWFPHVSPDGTKVVFITYTKGDVDPGAHPANKNVEIRMMPASGGEYKTLIKLFGGQGSFNVNSWAPDSKRFAFVSYEIVN